MEITFPAGPGGGHPPDRLEIVLVFGGGGMGDYFRFSSKYFWSRSQAVCR